MLSTQIQQPTYLPKGVRWHQLSHHSTCFQICLHTSPQWQLLRRSRYSLYCQTLRFLDSSSTVSHRVHESSTIVGLLFLGLVSQDLLHRQLKKEGIYCCMLWFPWHRGVGALLHSSALVQHCCVP
jgi:hypothetical protein